MTGRNVVVGNHDRVDPALVAALGAGAAATVHEAQGRSGLFLPRLRPIYPGATVSGTAVTVLCRPGDNLMIHLAVEGAAPATCWWWP
jgi:4-hydroxy-4-methyl-2-oxoglutarate aldolase